MRLPPPRPRLLALVAFAAVVLAAPLPRRAAADAEIKYEGKRVTVTSTVPWAPLAKRVADALDAALPVYEEHLPYRMPEGQRLVFHLYGLPNEYAEALKKAGAEGLARNLTATVFESKETHLLVQPRADREFLPLVNDLPEALRFAACREGVHQFLLRAGAPGGEWWPGWYAEGMADLLAERCLVAAAGKDAPRSILLDDRRHVVKDALERGRWLRFDRALFANAFEFDVYAQWGQVYRLLAADPERLKVLHERIRDLGKPSAPAPGEPDKRYARREKACADALAQVYGPLDALDARLKAQVAALAPAWFEALRGTERTEDGFVCAARPEVLGTAIAIRVEPAPKEPFVLSCEMNVLGVGHRQGELYLAYENRHDPRFLKIALRSDDGAGYVSLLAFANGVWQERFSTDQTLPNPLWDAGAWLPVRVEVTGSKISVALGGEQVLEADVPPGFDPLGNQVGLGALGDVVRFRKFEVSSPKR